MISVRLSNLVRWEVAVLCLLIGVVSTEAANAQYQLRAVNRQTTVGSLSFEFVDQQTLEEDRLTSQIATTAPSFWDRVQRILPLLESNPHPFSPVELHKDLVRLRHFYQRNGFLHPEIDYYEATRLDTASNEIDVVFTIREGPPVIIQDVGFYDLEGRYAFYQFPPDIRERWIRFRDDVKVNTGDRYTEFDRIRIRDEAVVWLQNRGYAFARVESIAQVDSTANTADIAFIVDPGPRARIDEIIVEGNQSVDENVIIRELPFESGEYFSARKLTQAQRELFSLSLFRLALTSVPEQPRDSTVDVLIRVREASLRYVTSQAGYVRENGVQLQGDWTHRNFLGAARTLTISAVGNTGIMATPATGTGPGRLFRGTVSLRQPFIYTTGLSGAITPLVEFRSDPLYDFSSREIGISTQLIYEIYPFRTASIQYAYSRVLQRTPPTEELLELNRDPYNRSTLTASAIFGKVDDFINPERGFLLRPFGEVAGTVLGSGVEYLKVGSQVTGYLPLTEDYTVAGRLFAGRMWPLGASKQALLGSVPTRDSLVYESRFDPIMFYLGGSNDLRGWNSDLAGDKTPRPVNPLRESLRDTIYEPFGGLSKLVSNVELRMPFPGLGANWGTAVFLDAGVVDNSFFSLNNIKAGTGFGIRYRTIVGFIRLDLAYKLTPSFEDLRDPEEVYRYRRGLLDEPPETSWRRRFNIHINIGQTF